MPAIVIRAREPRDIEALNEIHNCPGVIAGTLQLPYRSLEWRKEWLAPNANMHHLVAEIEGRVVGSLGLHLATSPRQRHMAGVGMTVHDDFQGQGVGAALLAAILDLADNWLGLRRVELHVYTDNAPAIHLYKKFGFEIEGTARHYAFRAGQYVDAYAMARLRG
jgi:L-phenylalanine/L-methionine N-acetyltransferase